MNLKQLANNQIENSDPVLASEPSQLLVSDRNGGGRITFGF